MGIYRKPTQTDTTIHFTSNHPLEHKLTAYNFYINIMLSTPITDQTRQQEWDTICTIAKNSVFFIMTHPQFNEQNGQNTKESKYFYTYTKKDMGHIYLLQPTHT
jgi:hypothetical protein